MYIVMEAPPLSAGVPQSVCLHCLLGRIHLRSLSISLFHSLHLSLSLSLHLILSAIFLLLNVFSQSFPRDTLSSPLSQRVRLSLSLSLSSITHTDTHTHTHSRTHTH